MEQLDAAFERLSESAAATLATEFWGIEVHGVGGVTRLDTERDDTFRLRSDAGEFVLKVAHPGDDPLVINLQTAAMAFVAETEPRLTVQTIVSTIDGEIEPIIDGRVARLLTWLPGVPLFTVRPDPARLGLLGQSLGQLSMALQCFDHPAAHRDFVWDSARLPLIDNLRHVAPWPEIDEVFTLFAERVTPRLSELPQQVIHNDFHPGNVLVDEHSAAFVTGVIDFGDTIHTVRVADLAVALSYLAVPLSIDDTAPFLDGFESVVPLTAAEKELLPVLVAARFAARIVINQHLARGNPDSRGDAAAAAHVNRQALAALLEKL
jgi:Ser/Thr protein kinase RdoA (MazF antagonist)